MVSPLISGYLPSPTRPVGLTSIHHPPRHAFSFPTPSIPSPDGSVKPALNLVDVEYAVYYPCEEERSGWFRRSGSGVGWIPNPVHAILAGYMRFAGQRHSMLGKLSYPLLRAIAGRVQIPARELAPLEPSPTARPLVIFSHGLAGTRHTYSSFCSNLAAQGYVVLAIEHKDGSGPAVTVRGGDDKPEILEYLNKNELDWSPDSTPSSPMPLRGKQLDLRLREVYETYHGFKRLINGETIEGLGIVGDHKPDVARSWLESLRGKVQVDEQVVGIGHSFGGATMLHLLQTPPPEPSTLPTIPLRACIALDPWMEPVPDPAPGAKPPKIPTMVINSDGFTVWTGHFAKLYKLVERANGSLLSIVGCDHQSFSDFPMLVPPSPAFAISLLDTIHSLSTAFLEGHLKDAKDIQGKTPDNGRPEIVGGGVEGKRRLKGEKGDVVVHCLGVEP